MVWVVMSKMLCFAKGSADDFSTNTPASVVLARVVKPCSDEHYVWGTQSVRPFVQSFFMLLAEKMQMARRQALPGDWASAKVSSRF